MTIAEFPVRVALVYGLGTLVSAIVTMFADGAARGVAGVVVLLLQIWFFGAIFYYRRHPPNDSRSSNATGA
jgi:uncharacterized membrane protein